jgi:CRISPR-associated endoribonuclease Cas6
MIIMLYSIVLEFNHIKALAYVAYSAVLKIIDSEDLHGELINPITVSPVFKNCIKVTFARPELYEKFISKIMLNRFLDINGKKVDIINIYTNQAQHKLAGFDTVESLSEKKFPNGYFIRFWSPTAFMAGDKYNILFSAKSFLSSLSRKSANFLGVEIGINQDLLESILIEEFNLYSEKYQIKNRVTLRGFKGFVKLKCANEEHKKELDFLVSTSKYFGCGIKTSMGMGQVG